MLRACKPASCATSTARSNDACLSAPLLVQGTRLVAVLFLVGCASGPPTSPDLPATAPAGADQPTAAWTKETGQIQNTRPGTGPEFGDTASGGVRSTMTVRCTITVEGLVRGCTVEQSVPSMDRAVLLWLGEQQYAVPVLNGERKQMSYVFHFAFCTALLDGPSCS
jgi:hypothetical protein